MLGHKVQVPGLYRGVRREYIYIYYKETWIIPPENKGSARKFIHDSSNFAARTFFPLAKAVSRMLRLS